MLLQVPKPWGGKSDSPKAESHEKRRIAFLKHLPKNVQDMINKPTESVGKTLSCACQGITSLLRFCHSPKGQSFGWTLCMCLLN